MGHGKPHLERVISDSEEVIVEQVRRGGDGTSQAHENYPDRGSSKYKGTGRRELRTFEVQKGSCCSWNTVNKQHEMLGGGGWQRPDHIEFL